MPGNPSPAPVRRGVDDRLRRLAVALATMVHRASYVRVTLHDPTHVWPHPHLHAPAYDAENQLITPATAGLGG